MHLIVYKTSDFVIKGIVFWESFLFFHLINISIIFDIGKIAASCYSSVGGHGFCFWNYDMNALSVLSLLTYSIRVETGKAFMHIYMVGLIVMFMFLMNLLRSLLCWCFCTWHRFYFLVSTLCVFWLSCIFFWVQVSSVSMCPAFSFFLLTSIQIF